MNIELSRFRKYPQRFLLALNNDGYTGDVFIDFGGVWSSASWVIAVAKYSDINMFANRQRVNITVHIERIATRRAFLVLLFPSYVSADGNTNRFSESLYSNIRFSEKRLIEISGLSKFTKYGTHCWSHMIFDPSDSCSTRRDTVSNSRYSTWIETRHLESVRFVWLIRIDLWLVDGVDRGLWFVGVNGLDCRWWSVFSIRWMID